ncbi:hypothetical protein AUJ15_03475 [Candidatus Micrarchaeota archaeon CG1_02_55_41]|nr:MAG: hypothetical protein AUJ15_03475 [Candidatus Micrarchaeota archaeon CG1_02_55_41]
MKARKWQVWMVDMPAGKGHEQEGERPAIVAGGKNGLITAIPLTSEIKRAGFSHTLLIEPTKENGLLAESVALVFQLTSLDENRFKNQIGYVTGEHRETVDDLLKDLLKLN